MKVASQVPKIFVTGRLQADDVLSRLPHKLTVITLRSRKDPSLKDPGLAKVHFEVFVDDIEEPLEGYTVPSRPEAVAILEAWRKCQGCQLVLLHCEAGISRSTAAAFGLLFLEGSDVPTSAKKLFEVNPFGVPNKRLLDALLATRYGPEKARVIRAQLIAAYTALQKAQEQGNAIVIPSKVP